MVDFFFWEVSFLIAKAFPGTEEIIDGNLKEEVNLEEEWSLEKPISSNLDSEDGLEKEVSSGGVSRWKDKVFLIRGNFLIRNEVRCVILFGLREEW